jgi:heat shock protein HtpX
LAHEFAHYYGGDTSIGPWLYKTQSASARIFQNIGSVGGLARISVLGVFYAAVVLLLKWYFTLFWRIISLTSRKREYRADELACIIAGSKSLIDGLRALHAAGMAWPSYWKTEISPVINNGALPAVAEGFARFVVLPRINDQIQQGIEKHIKESKGKPYDSHPRLRDRIEAARKIADERRARLGFDEDSNPARSLLDDAALTEMSFLENANPELKPGSLKSITWEELGPVVIIPAWKKFAIEYSTFLADVTIQSLPQQIPNLPKIGPQIRDPKGMLLDPAQRRRRAGQLFATGLGLALLDHGWVLHAGPGYCYLCGPAQTLLEPFKVMDALATGKLTASEWVDRCRALGIADLLVAPAESRTVLASS